MTEIISHPSNPAAIYTGALSCRSVYNCLILKGQCITYGEVWGHHIHWVLRSKTDDYFFVPVSAWNLTNGYNKSDLLNMKFLLKGEHSQDIRWSLWWWFPNMEIETKYNHTPWVQIKEFILCMNPYVPVHVFKSVSLLHFISYFLVIYMLLIYSVPFNSVAWCRGNWM